MSTWARNLAVLAVVFSVLACGRPPAVPVNSGTADGTSLVTYNVEGVLREIQSSGRKVLITHEAIPGYMDTMTMLFDVRGTNNLTAFHPGDRIRFRLLVTPTEGWIDNISASTNVPERPTAWVREDPPPAIKELQPGDPVPDCLLTNQFGKPIHLADFRGRALALTFIFIRCPFPTFCPRMNNNLKEVQASLMGANTPGNWQLLTVSFDPEFDTPARLASYAQGFGYTPQHWSFATGATADIQKLGGQFGLMFWREGPSFSHNVRTVVIDPKGRLQRVFNGNEWEPQELVTELKKAMAVRAPQ